MQKFLIRALAVWLLFVLAVVPGPTQTAAPKKGVEAPPPALKEKLKFADKKSKMSVEAGCNIANKGRKGQVCLYDIDRVPALAKLKNHPAVYVSPDNEESILWYSRSGLKFSISQLVARTKDCPAEPFAQKVTNEEVQKSKEKSKILASLETAVYSGPARKDALGCEYEPVFQVLVKGRVRTWDPHIIIGP